MQLFTNCLNNSNRLNNFLNNPGLILYGMSAAIIDNASRRSALLKDTVADRDPKRRRAHQNKRAVPITFEEKAWIRDLTDDEVILGAREPDPEFCGDFLCFWNDIRKRHAP